MSIPEIDNRIRIQPTEVNFDDTVGITGQAHDNFPDKGQQPRYDWMRSFLIGLLSNQSSASEPLEFRTGSLWFKRGTDNIFKVWDGDNWVDIANHIALSTDGDQVLTLAKWFDDIRTKVDAIQPRFSFSGNATSDNITSIPIPVEIQGQITDINSLRPFVYINGLLVDPRNSNFNAGCPTSVELSGGVDIDDGDSFTVVIEKVDIFITDEIVVH